jgi:antitoxin component YwqK of YwqJK toxin-antitoxin module
MDFAIEILYSIRYDAHLTKGTTLSTNFSKAEFHIEYHRDGSVWAKGQMLEGVPVGYWEWFRKDGTIMRSGSFSDGKQVGAWTTYDRDGKIYKVTKIKAIE